MERKEQQHGFLVFRDLWCSLDVIPSPTVKQAVCRSAFNTYCRSQGDCPNAGKLLLGIRRAFTAKLLFVLA